jgi:hypothetical protein
MEAAVDEKPASETPAFVSFLLGATAFQKFLHPGIPMATRVAQWVARQVQAGLSEDELCRCCVGQANGRHHMARYHTYSRETCMSARELDVVDVREMLREQRKSARPTAVAPGSLPASLIPGGKRCFQPDADDDMPREYDLSRGDFLPSSPLAYRVGFLSRSVGFPRPWFRFGNCNKILRAADGVAFVCVAALVVSGEVSSVDLAAPCWAAGEAHVCFHA